ncbi:hypothetical protein ACWGIN_31040 [Streptomyces sp. NPDC054861]
MPPIRALDGGTILPAPCAARRPTLLQSRRGSLIQDRCSDLVAAAAQVPEGLVR